MPTPARYEVRPNTAANCACACLECGRSSTDSSSVKHAKHCDTPALDATDRAAARVEAACESGRVAAARSVAREVRATSLTHGQDDAVYDAVRLGFLSVDDAMNTDD